MAVALRSIPQTATLLGSARGSSLVRPVLFNLTVVRGMRAKEFKMENPMNPHKPWPYETKPYKWYHSIFNLDRTSNRIDENSKVIVVEGNIGAGKSTLAKGLAEILGMRYYPEADFNTYYEMFSGVDLKKYAHELGPTAQPFGIKEFYEDPTHALVARMQVSKYVARYYQYCEALLHLFSTGQGVILERSAYSDFVFVDAMMKNGYVGRPARRYYYELKNNTIQDLMRPHCIIYLDAPVDVCMERIAKRNIGYEVNSSVITPEYLKTLENGYKEHYLPQMETFCQTLVYDWTEFADPEAIVEDLEKVEFDKHRYYYDPMFRDWSEFYINEDWDETRVKFQKWKDWAREHTDIPETYGAGELWVTADDNAGLRDLKERLKVEKGPYYVRPTPPYYLKPGSGAFAKFKAAFAL
ncbi:NADH dehydrogenase [ubiquinone] 1 alpha subcomplex subunit 10, mitochondrial [Hypsibius exemplaris]|uniref:NADH dehydrogenase [ubiquinone] 1 alpha subcomplex subunit 10, mitochondrial n=1 Tax=Hypsibius exemplaris TaxID=2072580 RepID=A0A1W0WVE5_HYPEX|nr:NADH dehydrogenase [ubiquinone] 1 alpha subcomplex subunit 10, mitochondrial [Hypsibius exemplaris]